MAETTVPKPCSVEGCPRPRQARGLCHTHYVASIRKSGLGSMPPLMTTEQIARERYENESLYKIRPSEPFRIEEGVVYLPLGLGFEARFDECDFELLSLYRWRVRAYTQLCDGTYTPYAVTKHNRRTIGMHRMILGAQDGFFVDHIDHDGLNNRRSNLRLATAAQNSYNVRKTTKPTISRFKGVRPYAGDGRWVAFVVFNQKRHYLGIYQSEADAAMAYDKKAIELFGEFACLNFPNKV